MIQASWTHACGKGGGDFRWVLAKHGIGAEFWSATREDRVEGETPTYALIPLLRTSHQRAKKMFATQSPL